LENFLGRGNVINDKGNLSKNRPVFGPDLRKKSKRKRNFLYDEKVKVLCCSLEDIKLPLKQEFKSIIKAGILSLSSLNRTLP
jgi:hypothetical protein